MRRKLAIAGCLLLLAAAGWGVASVATGDAAPQNAAAAALAPDPLTCQGYPERRWFLESQSWWKEAGAQEPPEGRHIHLGTCFPLHQDVSGVVHFDLVIKLHGIPGRVSLVRVQVFNEATFTKTVSLDCQQATCEYVVPMDVDTRQAPDGNYEFRMTANIKDSDAFFGRRFYETTRWHAVIDNGNPENPGSESRNRSPGAGGWYQGVEYENVFCGLNDSGYRLVTIGPLVQPFTLRCKFDRETAFASVDPNTHMQDFGHVLLDKPQGGTYDILIDPADFAPGPHKLMVKTTAHDGNGEGAGVLVLPFTVAGGQEPPPTTTEPGTTEPPPGTTEPPPATTEPPPATTEPPPTTEPPCDAECELQLWHEWYAQAPVGAGHRSFWEDWYAEAPA